MRREPINKNRTLKITQNQNYLYVLRGTIEAIFAVAIIAQAIETKAIVVMLSNSENEEAKIGSKDVVYEKLHHAILSTISDVLLLEINFHHDGA